MRSIRSFLRNIALAMNYLKVVPLLLAATLLLFSGCSDATGPDEASSPEEVMLPQTTGSVTLAEVRGVIKQLEEIPL